MSLGVQDMLDLIRNAGVVGAGGAGFPTHVKYQAKVEQVIANGAECEPLIRVDQQVMAKYPEKVLRGLVIAMECTGAARGVVALKAKYHEAIDALNEQIRLQRLQDRITLFLLDNFYPAGDEFVLVREVTGAAIPEFGLPLDVGVVVSNVSTLMDVADAVDHRQPVVERFVTVTGQLARPGTFRVAVGTPFSALVAAAGGALVDDGYLVSGGPMMGKLVEQDDVVTKTTSALLVLEENSPVVRRRLASMERQVALTRSACLKCDVYRGVPSQPVGPPPGARSHDEEFGGRRWGRHSGFRGIVSVFRVWTLRCLWLRHESGSMQGQRGDEGQVGRGRCPSTSAARVVSQGFW